jgi:hypothetical protein
MLGVDAWAACEPQLKLFGDSTGPVESRTAR